MPRGRGDLDLLGLLAAVEAAPPTASVAVLAEHLAERIGAEEVAFLIADFSGQRLVRLAAVGGDPGSGGRRPDEVPLDDGGEYDAVMRTQQPSVADREGRARVLAPVSNRGDTIGVLELVLPGRPDEGTLRMVVAAAHVLAYVVIANRRFTDLYEWGQRTTPFTLAAEIQRRLLPESSTCEAGQFALSAGLEPAADIGGDSFDYALDRDLLHVSISDAIGHEEPAALLATLLVGSLRNARRRGLSLAEQAAMANEAVARHGGGEQFVSALLLRVELATGSADVVAAGHPRPLLLRRGEVRTVDLDEDLPFGALAEARHRVQHLVLEPGDRLLLVTDGMLERNAARVDVARLLADTAHLHPREVVRTMSDAVLGAAGGPLRDDAAVLCLHWSGSGDERHASAGGGTDEASGGAR